MDEIKASELKKLVEVVPAAVGLWNACEVSLKGFPDDIRPTWFKEWCELKDALDALGVGSVEL